MQKWRNWQTRTVQVRVVEIPCGFDSHLLHEEECRDPMDPAFLFLCHKPGRRLTDLHEQSAA